jgi:hypothetical protein
MKGFNDSLIELLSALPMTIRGPKGYSDLVLDGLLMGVEFDYN